MNTYAKFAAAVALAAAAAMSVAVPSQVATSHRRYHHHWSSDRAYQPDTYHAWPGYGGAGYGAYASAPFRSSSDVNEEQCMMSPASQNYTPCFNH